MSLALDKPLIYLITKGEATPADFEAAAADILDTIRIAIDEKVSLVQIREKRLTAKQLFELTSQAAKITGGTSTRLLVNDRADIAVAAKADGVHLAANSLPVDVIRKAFGADLMIGVSTHSLEEAKRAKQQGADFVVFGPVFETPGKGLPVGVESLANVCEELRPFPVIALGGIDETNYASVLDAGADGFAAIRMLNDADKLRSIGREMKK